MIKDTDGSEIKMDYNDLSRANPVEAPRIFSDGIRLIEQASNKIFVFIDISPEEWIQSNTTKAVFTREERIDKNTGDNSSSQSDYLYLIKDFATGILSYRWQSAIVFGRQYLIDICLANSFLHDNMNTGCWAAKLKWRGL